MCPLFAQTMEYVQVYSITVFMKYYKNDSTLVQKSIAANPVDNQLASNTQLKLQICIIIINVGTLVQFFNTVIRDGDGVLNSFDNCADLPNADQVDTDRDGKG